jgi:phosphatidylglycerophosphate synthase
MLTLLGVIGAGMSFCGYWLSHHGEAWLWLAVVGIAINWLGDSLDGSLARFRKAERSRYGFFLDHMTDTLSMALIGIGIGLSPYVHLASAGIVLMVYYLMMILSLTTCLATGNFRISFNGIGPTEIRLFIIAFTLAAMISRAAMSP